MEPRRIIVLVPSDRTRAWAPRVCEVLAAQFGLPSMLARAVPPIAAEPPMPSEALELRVFARVREGHSLWVATDEAPTAEAVPWSECLVVNATGRDPQTLPSVVRSGVVLTPLFHGGFKSSALASPLLDGEPPHLGVSVLQGEACWLAQGGRAAVGEHEILHHALDRLFGRMMTLLRRTAEHLITGGPLAAATTPPPASPEPSTVQFWLRRARRWALPKLGHAVRKAFVHAGDWCVGYRQVSAETGPTELGFSHKGFVIVESPRSRFYADPLVMRHDGVTALFFEDYDYRARRGRISYVELGEDGSYRTPAEAVSRPYHLSYPFVFSHQGAALMIPETSINGTVELYEAERFPDRWRLRSVLMTDISAADVTVHLDETAGVWWMFAAVAEFGSSPNDTLSIYFSDRLEGPWRAHAANPVKFDPTCSRPGGPLLQWDQRLFRPAQDCSGGYGQGIALCEIKELTPYAFREEVVARYEPPANYTGLHTYGRAAGVEFVDFKRNRWRLGAPALSKLAVARRKRACGCERSTSSGETRHVPGQ